MNPFFDQLKKWFGDKSEPQREAVPLAIPAFPERSRVRVKKLLHPEDDHDSLEINQRPPRAGDIGTVVDVLYDSNLPTLYVVEYVDNEGKIIWFSEFAAEELEGV